MRNEKLQQIIASRLKSARDDLGLNQADVAEVLEIKRNAYSQIETGRNSLSVEHLVKLPSILGKPTTWFLGLPVTPDLTKAESELLLLYRELGPDDPVQHDLLDMLRGLLHARRQAKRKDL